MTRPLALPLGLATLLVVWALALVGIVRGGEDEAASPIRPWALVASADGATLYAACEAARQVLRFDVATRDVTGLALPGGPRGLALSPDGRTLAVSLGAEDQVALVDTVSRRLSRTLDVGMGPEGLAFAGSPLRLFVAERLGGTVGVFDLDSGQRVAGVPAGAEPFALAATPDRSAVVVVSRRAEIGPPHEVPASLMTVIDALTLEPRRSVRLPSVHLAESVGVTVDGAKALIPGLRVRNLLPILQVARGWVLSSVVAIVDLATGDVSVLPLNEEEQGFADPTAIAMAPDGRSAWVASGGGNELARLDLDALEDRIADGRGDRPENPSWTSAYRKAPIPVGRNPCGLAVLPSGAVAVSERLDGTVSLVDPEGNRALLLPPEGDTEVDVLLRGERAFHDASYCFQRAFSCRSCHPEAHTDGLTYDFEIDGVGRHVVLNRSLRGLWGTAPYKWTGINPSLQRQCGARFAMVLTRAAVMPPDTLDALAAWLESLPPPRPLVDADGAYAELVARGRALFERSRRKDGTRLRPSERCITCHPPPHYTNRQRTDVGSYAPGDPVRAFDVPHLTGVGQKAPYLHDGRATSLEAIFTSSGLGDRHGFVSDLDEADRRALVAFLQSL